MPTRTRLAPTFWTLLMTALGIAAFSPLLSGCGILVGNTRPLDEKSESYGVSDLSKIDSDWTKLDPGTLGSAKSNDPETTSTEVPDVAFQSKTTASIISLDSACRAAKDYQDRDLRSLTNILLLGASNVTLRDEKPLDLQGGTGLQTTLQGRINGENVKLRTLVLKRQDCVYDLVYIARPDTFSVHEEDFSHFVASLRLK